MRKPKNTTFLIYASTTTNVLISGVYGHIGYVAVIVIKLDSIFGENRTSERMNPNDARLWGLVRERLTNWWPNKLVAK